MTGYGRAQPVGGQAALPDPLRSVVSVRYAASEPRELDWRLYLPKNTTPPTSNTAARIRAFTPARTYMVRCERWGFEPIGRPRILRQWTREKSQPQTSWP